MKGAAPTRTLCCRSLRPSLAVRAETRAQVRMGASYANAWDWYINGHVVSELNRRYIVNLLGATTAKVSETPVDDASDDDSDEDLGPDEPEHVGSLNLVQRTLDGINATSKDDGESGFGRDSTSIRLGRNMWQTAEMPQEAKSQIRESVFEPSLYPNGRAIKAEFTRLQKADEERPAPFDGRTEPYAHLAVHDYGKRIEDWFARLRERFETLTLEGGDLGGSVDDVTGEIKTIATRGQLWKAGVQKGWHLRDVNGRKYSKHILAEQVAAKGRYTLVVEKHVPYRGAKWQCSRRCATAS